MSPSLARQLLALAALAGLAGCGTSSTQDLRSESPYVLHGCIHRDAGQLLTLPSGPGSGVTRGVVMGEAARGVILVPDRDATVCQWLTYGQMLVGRGYRVALYDWDANIPEEQQLAAVVGAVREQGVRSVVLVGAGEGANASLIGAARIRPAVAGVVALSPPLRIEGQPQAEPSVRSLRMPLLLVSADQDPTSAARMVRRFDEVAPAEDKEVMLVPGRSNGVDLLSSAEGDQVGASVTTFLDRVAPTA